MPGLLLSYFCLERGTSVQSEARLDVFRLVVELYSSIWLLKVRDNFFVI